MDKIGTTQVQANHARKLLLKASGVTGNSPAMSLDSQVGIENGQTLDRPSFTKQDKYIIHITKQTHQKQLNLKTLEVALSVSCFSWYTICEVWGLALYTG